MTRSYKNPDADYSPNDLGDYEQNTLYKMKTESENVAKEAAKLGMKVGDWELLPQEEKETLLEWKTFLEEDINLDQI